MTESMPNSCRSNRTPDPPRAFRPPKRRDGPVAGSIRGPGLPGIKPVCPRIRPSGQQGVTQEAKYAHSLRVGVGNQALPILTRSVPRAASSST